MKEFALIFRLSNLADFKPSPEQMQARMKWLNDLAASDQLSSKGNTLLPMPTSSRTISSDLTVAEKPFSEGKEVVTGYVTVSVPDIDAAVEIAKANPIFEIGGTVEVREVLPRH